MMYDVVVLSVIVSAVTTTIINIVKSWMSGRKRKNARTNKDDEQVIMVKRTKPSFKNPAKTTKTVYDEYRTTKGLYAPFKPGKRKGEEIELDRR